MIAALRGARRIAGRLRRASRTRIAILLYHRVFDSARDAQKLCVSVERFAMHLEILKRRNAVVPLEDAVEALRGGRLPKRAVAITFDDGYVDNLTNAKPILARFAAPATVFVATGYLGRDREFWWDELERLLLVPDALPSEIALRIGGETRRWTLGGGACDSSWAVDDPSPHTPRQRAYLELHRLLRPLTESERDTALADLRRQVSDDGRPRDGYRAMTEREVAALADGGLISVGAHTVTHPVLATQSADAQRWELSESRARLESILGKPVTTASYPYGGSDDVAPATAAITRAAGFDAACANVPGLAVARRVDPFWLPRFIVRDWDADRFDRELATFFGG